MGTLGAICFRQAVFLAALVVANTSVGKLSIDLFNSKVTQLLVSEKVLPDGRHVIHLVGVLWVFLLVRGVPRSLRPCERHEAGRSVRNWLGRPNHMTVEEAIVYHALPRGTTFGKLLHAGCVSFQIVPLLWLPRIRASILARGISAIVWAEGRNVSRAGAEHRHEDVVWIQPSKAAKPRAYFSLQGCRYN